MALGSAALVQVHRLISHRRRLFQNDRPTGYALRLNLLAAHTVAHTRVSHLDGFRRGELTLAALVNLLPECLGVHLRFTD